MVPTFILSLLSCAALHTTVRVGQGQNTTWMSITEEPSIGDHTTAGKIWPAGQTLAEQLGDFVDVRGKLVMELGSGTGVLGLAAAASAARRVLLTDMHVATAERNRLASRAASSVATKVLVWGDAEGADEALLELGGYPDIILGGDIIYRGFDLGALLDTLRMLTDSEQTTIILSYKHRTGGNAETGIEFERGLSRRGFTWTIKLFDQSSADDGGGNDTEPVRSAAHIQPPPWRARIAIGRSCHDMIEPCADNVGLRGPGPLGCSDG